ncbi:phosphatase PAP2 family protein [Salinisphaera sp. Q1T1-3]|uniref:phosphatase PAP2 family protein n=1 Tax=Salinisphaera sp. Q1T1-3 TaxID=2321229 RepID=UPI0013142890|nr:phosphatase PAP2 family protein [Salinisphaera sp. Q1T1-3]
MPRWQPRALGLSLGLAVLLFATYLAPGTDALWRVLDIHTAYALNGLVAQSPTQQLLWSFGNLKVFDYLVGLLMLGVLVHFVVYGRRGTSAWRAAASFIVCIALVGLVSITRDLIFKGMAHDSPSLVLPAFTLLDNTNGLGAKDASHTSFPGDHATVVATFVYLLWCFAGRHYGRVAGLIAIVACLPRLVAGAHWLTDDLVGGLGTALVTVPWVVHTPLGGRIVARLEPAFARIMPAARSSSARAGSTAACRPTRRD